MKSYIISGHSLWFARSTDSFFNSKWHGLNSSEKHLIDYFAMQHGNKWLDCTGGKIEVNKSKHYYNEIVESVEVGNNLIILYKKLKKNAVLEVGVNIRNFSENLKIKDYNVKVKTHSINVDELTISSDKRIINVEKFYKTHFPGAQRTSNIELDEKAQHCLVLRIHFEKTSDLIVNIGLTDKFEKRGVNKTLIGKYFINNVIIAGYPYFTQCWVRDFSLCVKPLLKLGYIKEVKDTIKEIIKHQRSDGLVPSRLDSEELSDDSTAWFALALKDYYLLTKDDSFEDNREKCLKTMPNTGVTWMDSIERFKAYELPWIYKAAGKKVLKKELKLEKGINSIFLVYLNLLNNKEKKIVLKDIEDNYTTDYGVASGNTKNTEYDINSYHQGSVWNYLTAIMALCEFEDGNTKKAAEYLKKLSVFVSENCLYHLPETRKDYSTGFAQLWSDVLYEYAKLFIKTKQ